MFELRGAVLALFAADKLAADGRAAVKPRQGGGCLTKEPIDAEFFAGRSAYFADPEDNYADPEDNYWEIAWAQPDTMIVAARRAADVDQ